MKRILLFLVIAACSTLTVQKDASYVDIPSVQIGTEIWSTTNLSVDTFQNGEKIPEAKTSGEWNEFCANGIAAFFYYDFDSTNNDISGKLYNWFAVNDPRGIAPKGWHVATNEEWEKLIRYAGGPLNATEKLKADSGWLDLSGITTEYGTDEYGFSATPTGELHKDGVFSAKESMGVYWTSTEYEGPPKWGNKSGELAWDVVIWYSNTMSVKRQTFPKVGSGAIRCVRNK